MTRPTYNPEVFETDDIEAARRIIVTPEGGLSTEERWRTETPYLAALFTALLDLNPESVVLDFGCGIGRIAKALIDRAGCTVVGVDLSPTMRKMSLDYVDSDRFVALSPPALRALSGSGARFDAAFSAWVLQHVEDPAAEIDLLRSALSPGAPVAVVNNVIRAIPAKEYPWVNDGIDIAALLRMNFSVEKLGRLDPRVVTKHVSEQTFFGLYRT